jgi:hypothetical protein
VEILVRSRIVSVNYYNFRGHAYEYADSCTPCSVLPTGGKKLYAWTFYEHLFFLAKKWCVLGGVHV